MGFNHYFTSCMIDRELRSHSESRLRLRGIGVAKKNFFGVNIGVALVKQSSILFLFKKIFILQMLSDEQKYITINITRFKKS
jgi:hypothetical protein